jgi:hypothetical protein
MMNTQGGRYAVLADSSGRTVINGVGAYENLARMLDDRKANGEALPGEHVVRLPRRMCRRRPWEDFWAMIARLNRWTTGNPFWPLDNEEPRRLPIEE